VPALLASLALGLAATPAAMAAPATCAPAGFGASTDGNGSLGQEFTVGPDGGDLHAYDVLASSTSGAAALSVVPLDATGNPDVTAPITSATVDLPADFSPTTVTFAKPQRLGPGTYVVVVTPDTNAAWLFCAAATPTGGAWLRSVTNWARSDSASFALGLDLQPEDLTAPVVSIAPPVSPTRAPSVVFTSDDADATSTCSVDGGAFADCTSPFAPTGLSDGAHAVAVVATDIMGNASAPASASFTVDTTAPTAKITIAPGNAADHTATVTVALSEPGTYTCAVDGAAVVPTCAAPSFDYVPTAEGAHTVTITATDGLGNTGDSTADFTADWTAPVVAPVDDIEVPAGTGDDGDRQRPGAVVDFDVTATDNLDAAPTVTCNPASGSFFPLGATTVTCTAADASGNPSAPVTFQVTVVPPPPDAADIDVAYDPTDDALAFSETHGGDIAFPSRRTIVATAAGHTTRGSIRRTHSVGDQGDLDAAMRFVSLRYDDGPRLRPTTNGYGYRSSERRDGSLKRVVIVARAGRTMVIVKYSAGSDRSSVRYLRRGRTLRVVRVDGLAIPHLRTEGGTVVVDVAGGG
jgi:hypothetical protein